MARIATSSSSSSLWVSTESTLASLFWRLSGLRFLLATEPIVLSAALVLLQDVLELPSMLDMLEFTRRILTLGTSRRPSAPGATRETSRARAERVEPVGEVERPAPRVWFWREVRDSERRVNEAEYCLHIFSVLGSNARCGRDGVDELRLGTASVAGLFSPSVEWTPRERCGLATYEPYARTAASSASGVVKSRGGAKLYTLARHALEPSVHPGIGLLSSSGSLWTGKPQAVRFGFSGQSAAWMRRAAIMMPPSMGGGDTCAGALEDLRTKGRGGGRGAKP